MVFYVVLVIVFEMMSCFLRGFFSFGIIVVMVMFFVIMVFVVMVIFVVMVYFVVMGICVVMGIFVVMVICVVMGICVVIGIVFVILSFLEKVEFVVNMMVVYLISCCVINFFVDLVCCSVRGKIEMVSCYEDLVNFCKIWIDLVLIIFVEIFGLMWMVIYLICYRFKEWKVIIVVVLLMRWIEICLLFVVD